MNLSKNKLFIISLICLFIVLRIIFIFHPFWGLEYEDSFIYNDTARYLSFDYDYKSMPFKCQSCIDGSYRNCYSYGSFGGHFLTLPFIVAFFNFLFSYNYYNIFILNFIFSILLLSYVIFWSKKNKSNFSLPVFIIILSLTPYVVLFNTSGLSETLSSLFVVVFFLSIFKLNENDFRFSSIFILAFFSLVIAILTKRENLILLVFLYLIPLIRYYYHQKFAVKNYIIFVLSSTVLLFVLTYNINIFEVESNEGLDVGSATFSLNNLFINIRQLFLALIDYSFWGITGIVFILSSIYFFLKKVKNKLSVFSFILIVLYILVYSSHYRSYYQVKFNLVHPFETLRYSTNYFPIIAIFITSINFSKIEGFNLLRNKFLLFPLLILLVFNVYKLRLNFSEDEYYSRIRPIKTTLKYSKKNDLIITDLPIIFHCFIKSNQTIIDMNTLQQSRLNDLLIMNKKVNIFYLKPKNDNYGRYNLLFNDKKFTSEIWHDKQYKLLKYKANDTPN